MKNKIPIKNIYYMVLYAYNKIKNKNMLSDKDLENDYTLSDTIVHMFLYETNKIIKHGLYRDYNDFEEDSVFIKGKIDIKKSIKPNDVKKHIQHDLFNVNSGVNRVLKNTLLNIIYSNISKDKKNKAKKLIYYFNQVDSEGVNDATYKKIILNKSNQRYDFALKLSVLINKKLMPRESLGSFLFFDVEKDKETMSTIYEEFLRNFYNMHTSYKVNKRKYKWYLIPFEDADISKLPTMETDIEIVKDKNSKIIIDAKYYLSAINSYYDTEKLLSNNMYQMNTYLQHNLSFENLRGILLYPSVDFELDQKFMKDNQYSIEFKTINLNQSWRNIEEDLLNIID